MCGICGIVRRDGARPVEREVVRAMTTAMTHRGPDDEGFHIGPGVALGSRRLSIIDVDGGHQPIANEDERLRIVFNGEIYNYRALRDFLLRKGHRFRTQSDTEVVLHLYEELGEESVERLSGIFAFAIWDEQRRELFAARDRMGVKPFYFAETADGLTFGSELAVVLTDPGVGRRLDHTALNQYLSFEFVPTPRTMLQDVRRLPAAHVLRWDGRSVTTKPYWELSLRGSESQPPVRWRDYAGQLRERLRDAVTEEMVSDVPVGVLLSGGLDSSTVAAMMVDAQQGPVDSFSVAFDDPAVDESRYATLVARSLGTRHHELRVTGGMAAELVPRLADVLDEPLADASFIPTYLLSRFAAEHVKVALGGDGSDELFGGYPTLVAHRLIERYERVVPWTVRARAVPRLMRRLPVSFDHLSPDFKLRRFLAGRGVPLEVRHHRWMGAFVEEEKDALLQPWLHSVRGDAYEPALLHARASDARLPLNRILYDDTKLYLEGDILTKVDRASMAASLEVRVPFLNRTVVDFASTLPLELKVRGTTGKYLLKRAMADRLPREIVHRSKRGFAMPVARWLTTDLRDLTTDLLSHERIANQGLFEPSYVDRLLREHLDQRHDHRKLLWTLLVFQLWHAKFLESR